MSDGLFFEDLSVGQTASFGKTITEADIVLFAAVTGDTNPMHLNADYAKGTVFGERIAHGMLAAGLITKVLGTQLPGPGTAGLLGHPQPFAEAGVLHDADPGDAVHRLVEPVHRPDPDRAQQVTVQIGARGRDDTQEQPDDGEACAGG